jgi:putative transposase
VECTALRSGHVWQNRFYSCPLDGRHLWVALRYVEQNPVRALMVRKPEEWEWSSARVHLLGVPDRARVLDREFWERSGGAETWAAMHGAAEDGPGTRLLRRCTYAGRPFGDEEFVAGIEARFGRKWRRWGFEKAAIGCTA